MPMTSQNQDTDVFRILGELIEEQKKKHALPISHKILSQSNQLDVDCSKNEHLGKAITCFSDLGLEIPSDPLIIKTYPNALRYIIYRIWKDPSLLKKIAEMVKEQANYEEKWWNDRQALIKSLKDKQELSNMISYLSGTEKEKTSEETVEHELLLYDSKVHRAMQEISKVQEKELQRLGMPFFVDADETNIENKKKIIQLLKDLVSK